MEIEPTAKNAHIVGRYALYDAIAAGGMATVHYGRLLGPVGFSRTVAIKRLHAQFARDPEFVSMFLDEARLAARIRHPNVVPTLDVVATDGELFLVMEYVPGESLIRLIRTAASAGSIIPPRISSAIICGMLRGLHAAHEATNERGEPLGIVHRDVSPQNVLVGIDGQSRVLDFGVAKAAGRLQTTRDGKLKGKLAYMSPEQLRGKGVDRRTDIFAASAVLWETLTGRRLFRGDNEGAIITQILDGRITPPSEALGEAEGVDAATIEVIRAADAITLKGLALQHDQRWETARAMAAALERAVPPAGVSEVSDWVEHFAKDVLISRAQQVADIESNSAVAPASVRAVRDSGPDAGQDTAIAAPSPAPSGPRSGGAASAGEERSVAVDLSTISVASQAQPGSARHGSPWRGRAVLWAVVGLVGTMGSVGVFMALRSVPGRAAAAAVAASSPQVGESAPAVTTPAPAVVASASPAPPAETAAPSAATESEATVVGTAAAAVEPRATVGSKPAHHPTAPMPRGAAQVPTHTPTAPSCNPPYTYDAQGLKHFKPECL